MAACDVEDIKLIHEPLVPCRPHTYGEGIFVEHWQKFLASMPSHGDGYQNEMFESLFWMQGVNQRSASVAASFFSWLGTNCGNAYLHQAEKRAAKTEGRIERGDAYLVEWVLENRRRAGTNGGMRTIEAVIGSPRRNMFGEMIEIPDVSFNDAEIIETCAEFLGSGAGQALIKAALEEIEETGKEYRERQNMQHRAKMRALNLLPDDVGK